MERLTEDGKFTQHGAEQSAAEFRQLRPELAESVVVMRYGEDWVVAVRPGWRLCEKCNGEGWVGESKEYACVDSILGSAACVNGWVRIAK